VGGNGSAPGSGNSTIGYQDRGGSSKGEMGSTAANRHFNIDVKGADREGRDAKRVGRINSASRGKPPKKASRRQPTSPLRPAKKQGPAQKEKDEENGG